MANLLEYRVACVSIDLLKAEHGVNRSPTLKSNCAKNLHNARDAEQVGICVAKGAIGVVETHEANDVPTQCAHFVDKGV